MHAKELENMLTEYMNMKRIYQLNTCMKADKEDEAVL